MEEEEGAGCPSTQEGGGEVMSKIFHTFGKTEKKIISPISFSEINDKQSIP